MARNAIGCVFRHFQKVRGRPRGPTRRIRPQSEVECVEAFRFVEPPTDERGVDPFAQEIVVEDEKDIGSHDLIETPQNARRPVIAFPDGENAVEAVASKETCTFKSGKENALKVTVINCGDINGLAPALTSRGCDVTVVPFDTSAEDILAAGPDGIIISNGPGDPAENTGIIAQAGKLIGKKPVLGISLGHQILALAMGGRAEKLTYGHRGSNQPVTDLRANRTYVTAQNHGYAVVADSLVGTANQTMINANDGSCEALEYPGLSCFSVQFIPEACSDLRDGEGVFEKFIGMMGGDFNA